MACHKHATTVAGLPGQLAETREFGEPNTLSKSSKGRSRVIARVPDQAIREFQDRVSCDAGGKGRMDRQRAGVQAPGEPTFELHTLGWRAFQGLCAAVLSEVWGRSDSTRSRTPRMPAEMGHSMEPGSTVVAV